MKAFSWRDVMTWRFFLPAGVGGAGEPAPGYISSFASSMWRGTSSVIGAGVTSVKWVADKGASATSSVASHVPVVNRYVAKSEGKNKSDWGVPPARHGFFFKLELPRVQAACPRPVEGANFHLLRLALCLLGESSIDCTKRLFHPHHHRHFTYLLTTIANKRAIFFMASPFYVHFWNCLICFS